MKPLRALPVVIVLLAGSDSEPLHAQGYDPMARAPAATSPMLPRAAPAGRERGDGAKPNPELGNLPGTPGVEDTFYLCTACHSAAIIKQQRISDARWDYLWGWMVREQGMPEQDSETKQRIMSYLKRHFSSDR